MSRRYKSSSSDSSEDEAVSFKRAKKSNGVKSKITYIPAPDASNSNGANRSFNGVNRRNNEHENLTYGSYRNNLSKSRSNIAQNVVEYPQESMIARSLRFAEGKALQEAKEKASQKEEKERAKNFTPSQIAATMGFEKGKGFAKFISEPAPVKFSLKAFEEKIENLKIDDIVDRLPPYKPKIEEKVRWIEPAILEPLDIVTLSSWRKAGPMKTSVESTNGFIDSEIYNDLIACKKVFQDFEEAEYQKVRSRSNVFEKIGKGPFISRAGMKMVNLDAVLGLALTEPKTQSGQNLIGPNELMYFADVCAGPGGFSEYILWKKKWEAKGFGLTLKGDLDFDTKNFVAGHPESFETYYGPANDGDIYKPDNALGFIRHVLANTEGKGVHLMMADGGFAVSKEEHLQEILSGQIILSQCFVALGIVRPGGNFVCKLFDVFTPLTVGLIYLMYITFDLVSIHKPNTSRPANSERYLICKWKKDKAHTDAILKYLCDSHRRLYEASTKSSKEMILEIVPMSIISDDNHPFHKFIMFSNELIAVSQIQAIKRMIEHVRDPELVNGDQLQLKQESFEVWKVPQEVRLPEASTEKVCKEILDSLPLTMLKKKENDLVPDMMETALRSPYDWRFVVVGATKNSEDRGFFLGMGRNMVYRYDGYSNWTFINTRRPYLELSRKTLLYGELVEEIQGKVPHQNIVTTFYIIDALMLGGKDIRTLHYTQRRECCVTFAKAMTKPGMIPIRVKEPIRMENILQVLDKLEQRVISGTGVGSRLVCPIDMDMDRAIQPKGLLFIKITRDPWQMALDRSANRKVFFNAVTGRFATDEVPDGAIAGFFWAMSNRILWTWDHLTNVILPRMDQDDPRNSQLSPDLVHSHNLVNHVYSTLRTATVFLKPHPPINNGHVHSPHHPQSPPQLMANQRVEQNGTH